MEHETILLVYRTILVSLIVSFVIQRLIFWKDKNSKKGIRQFLQCTLILTFMLLLIHRTSNLIKIQLSFIIIMAVVFNLYRKNVFISAAVSFFTNVIVILSDICGGLIMYHIFNISLEQLTNKAFSNLLFHVIMLLIATLLSEVVNRTCRDSYIHKKILKKHEIFLPLLFIITLYIISILSVLNTMQLESLYEAQLLSTIIIFMIMSLIISYFVFLKEHLIQKNEYESIKMKIEVDAMTNTLTRDFGLKYMREQIVICSNKNIPISFGFIDINNLKLINDNYGHLEGDKSIIKVSEVINNILRKSDLICRIGGDEFIFALPGCNYEKAEDVVNRLKFHLEKESMESAYEISVSVGLYEKNPLIDINLEDIINKIDKEMYKDKQNYRHLFERLV